jgi:hypothetical protein
MKMISMMQAVLQVVEARDLMMIIIKRLLVQMKMNKVESRTKSEMKCSHCNSSAFFRKARERAMMILDQCVRRDLSHQ